MREMLTVGWWLICSQLMILWVLLRVAGNPGFCLLSVLQMCYICVSERWPLALPYFPFFSFHFRDTTVQKFGVSGIFIKENMLLLFFSVRMP